MKEENGLVIICLKYNTARCVLKQQFPEIIRKTTHYGLLAVSPAHISYCILYLTQIIVCHYWTTLPPGIQHKESTSKLPLDILPLNSLEGTACHIYDATCRAGYHSYKPLSNSFKESSCTFFFSPFKRKGTEKEIVLMTYLKTLTTELNQYCFRLH